MRKTFRKRSVLVDNNILKYFIYLQSEFLDSIAWYEFIIIIIYMHVYTLNTDTFKKKLIFLYRYSCTFYVDENVHVYS